LKNIYFPSFGENLGFANSAFQYLFLSHISKLFSFNLLLGRLKSGSIPNAAILPIELFGIKNYGIYEKILQFDYEIELSTDRIHGYYDDISKIQAFLSNPKFQTLKIFGYFQYHTSLMDSCGLKKTFDEIYLPKSEKIAINKFQKILYDNQQFLNKFYKNKIIIVCHIRLGDYKVYESKGVDFTYLVDILGLIKEIKNFIVFNYIRSFEIYIASDEPDECVAIFQKNGLNPLTIKSFFSDIDLKSSKALMFDLASISIANIFYASNSSFSLFGSLLNRKQALFFRPSPKDKKMIGFLPWDTQILFKKSLFYPSTL